MSIIGHLIPRFNCSTIAFPLPCIPAGGTIPHEIHQTFKTHLLPAELQANVDNIKVINPGWTHRVYDDADIESFIAEVYGSRILDYYHRINPKYGAAKADLFRYLLLYKRGGVYLDIKSTLAKPLDEALQAGDIYVLSQWKNGKDQEHAGWGCARELRHFPGGEFQQWHIIAAPGHPFLRAVIENVLKNIDSYNPWLQGTGSAGVFRVTGPVAYTLAILPQLSKHRHRISSDTELGFGYTLFKSASHRPLFETHYAKQTESVIKMQGTSKVLAGLYNLTKQAKRRVWHILRNHGLVA